MKTRLFSALLALSFSCAAEKKTEAPRAAAPVAKPTPAPEPVGLGAKDNDPEVVALAKAALACPRDRGDLFDTSCAAYKAFNGSKAPGKAHATLLNFVEDADERTRYLGAVNLPDGFATSPKPDHVVKREPALRLIRALAAEKTEPVANALAELVGHIEVEDTGLLEKITAVVKEHPNRHAARRVLRSLLMVNSDSRATYEYMLSMTKDADAAMRDTAAGAFWTGGLSWKPETCKMWEEHLADADPGVAGSSAQHLGWYGGECAGSWDAMLQSIDARIQARTTGAKSSFATGLEKLCEQEKVKPAQKKQATVLAKKLVADTEQHVFVRQNGLSAVHACAGAGSRPFVARYTRDKEEWVRERAQELLKAKRR